jgi:hypothetical protein
MFTFNGGTASIPLTVNTPGIFFNEINDTIEDGIYIRLGYKDTSWFISNPTFILKSGEHVYDSVTGEYKIGDGVTELQYLTLYGGSSSMGATGATGPAGIGVTGATGPAGTGSNIYVENGLTYSGGILKLGGELIENTNITGNIWQLYLNPKSFSLDTGNGDIDLYAKGNVSITSTLAGALNGDTTISADGSLGLRTGSGATVLADAGRIDIQASAGAIHLTSDTVLITDNISNKGAEYSTDYSANFTSNSLITKDYLVNYVATASSNISANNGLTISSNNVQLGGTLNQTTTINGGSNLLQLGVPGNRLDSLFVATDNDFSVNANTGNVDLNSNNGSINLDAPNDTIAMDAYAITATTHNLNGIVYSSDYSSTFINESLITKRYLINYLATASSNGGGITGSGVANRIAYYNRADSITSSSNLLFDSNYLTYSGANMVVTTTFSTPVIKSTSSAGLNIYSNGGTQVLNLGAGGGANGTMYGQLSMNSNKIISVATGSNPLDAVNYGQMNTSINSATTSTYNFITSSYVPYTGAIGDVNLGTKGLIVGSITASGLDITTHKITSVATGSNPLDAVNYGQLSNTQKTSIGFGADGSGGTLAVGTPTYLVMAFGGTITQWDIVGNTAGSAVFDVWKSTNQTLPTVANTIVASAKPTIASASNATSIGLTGWGVTFSAGDIYGFNIDSIAAFTKVNLSLRVNKS